MIIDRPVAVQPAKCPHCGAVLYTSQNPRYVYQCLECDEDFYEVEANYKTLADRDMALKILYKLIEDELYDPNNGVFDNQFYGIGNDGDDVKPITAADVYNWFNSRYSRGFYSLL